MLFTFPIPFKEALKYRKAQRVLPTSAGSAEIAKLGAAIRERALFSAKTSNLGYLAKMDKMLTGMVSPAARAAGGESAVDVAQFRLEMKAELAKLKYQPEEGKAGTLQDLGSDARLNLIADMQEKFAHGYGQHVAGQDPDVLDLWPCQELVRVEERNDKRKWKPIWISKGGKLSEGRMVARKDDPIWTEISAFGLPYPPFDYQSGMGLRDVRRDEAEALGVIKRSTIVQPDKRGFNEEVQVFKPTGISPGLMAVVEQTFKAVGDKIVLEAAI